MADPSQALANLLKVVERNRAIDNESGNAKSNGWVSAIIIFFVVLIATFVFAYVSNRNSKELAKLRHDKNKRKILAENKEALAATTQNDFIITRCETEITELQREMDGIDMRLDKVEHARKTNHKAIELITSWRDI